MPNRALHFLLLLFGIVTQKFPRFAVFWQAFPVSLFSFHSFAISGAQSKLCSLYTLLAD